MRQLFIGTKKFPMVLLLHAYSFHNPILHASDTSLALKYMYLPGDFSIACLLHSYSHIQQ